VVRGEDAGFESIPFEFLLKDSKAMSESFAISQKE